MRFFIRYFVFLFITLTLLSWYIPIRYDAPYPQSPGPEFDNGYRTGNASIIDRDQAQIVLVGDSVLWKSVDPELLPVALGIQSHVIAIPASTTAMWYLILNNVILEAAQNKPGYLVIFFRDTILTQPNYRVGGGYVAEIDEFATSHEDFLIERAYLNFMNPLEKLAEARFPVYGSRGNILATLDYYSRVGLPSLILPCKWNCLEQTLTRVYDVDNVRDDFRVGILASDETTLYSRRAMDFDHQIGRSFLPEIIRLCRENGIQLIVVQARTFNFPSADAQPKALLAYKQDLYEYLAQNNVLVLDFSYDSRLPEEFFNDPLHMNETGKAAFTQILADALKDVIQAQH